MRRISICILLLLLCCQAVAQQYFPIKVDKKWGMIDADGKIILEPRYDAIGEFKQFGYAIMQRDGGVGMLNKSGAELVPPLYDDLKVLDSTLIAVMEQGDWQVINLKGDVILSKGYDRVQVWNGKYLCFEKNRLWGLADVQGRQICDAEYDQIEYLDSTYFRTRKQDLFGLVGNDGQLILEAGYRDIKVHNDQLIFFRQGELWGAVDATGAEKVTPDYETFQLVTNQFFKLGKAQRWDLYSIPAQDIIVKGEYDNFYPFTSDYLLCKKNRLMGLIDAQGKTLLLSQYNEIQACQGQYFRARYKGRWGLLGPGDQIIAPFEYDYIAPPKGRICIVKKEDRYGAVNMAGELVISPDFERIEFQEEQAQVKAYIGDVMSLFYFNEQGDLEDENEFKKHFTITIGKKRDQRRFNINQFEAQNNYLLDDFEWFYSSVEDRWGLRRLDDGSVQIEPAFDWIRIESEHGFTLVGIEKRDYYDFEWTKFRFEMVYGLVNNAVGLLVTRVELLDVRLDDFVNGYPTARCIFNSGRHGLIARSGKIVRKDFAYIGDFKDGLARMSAKGRLSGSFKDKDYELGALSKYLNDLLAPNYRVNYTLYDQEFEEEAHLICNECEWGYIDTAGNVIVQPQYTFARPFVNEVGIVEFEGQWGMLAKNGQTLIPCRYDKLHFLENTNNKILRVYKSRQKYGLIDTLGQVMVDLNYDEIGAFSNGRLAVKRNNMWGFVNKNGLEIIPCRFRRVRNFNEGYASVQVRGNWGLIDKQGDVVLDFNYRRMGDFKEGLIWVHTKKGVGYVNEKGAMIIPPSFSKAFNFEGDVARVIVNGRYGLINKKGEYILRPRYSKIEAFDQYGLAIVIYGNRLIRYGLMNRQGKMVTTKDFREIRPFNEGRAVVKYRGAYGYIDPSGKLAIAANYSKAAAFSEGRAAVQRNGVCGYIDITGKEVIDLEYSKCLDFIEGKAVVYKGYRQGGIIDRTGNYVIEPSIDRLLQFTEGRGLVRDEQYRFYYITEQSKLNEGYYQKAGEFQHGVAVVQSEGRWGVINQKGIAIIPPKYDKIEDFEDGYAKVRIQGFSGLTNLQGELIVQPTYEYISYAGEGVFRVEQGDKIGYFDSDGNWIWDLKE
ncbi:MAG: WG repeat-containing protein [Bacteroidota bacterium]